ncbi:MAG TPA: ABC transporter permease, partial [Vicinamibacterales bacterium]|nr:ABC transporter permease [Vicinamibacterales bacterium]
MAPRKGARYTNIEHRPSNIVHRTSSIEHRTSNIVHRPSNQDRGATVYLRMPAENVTRDVRIGFRVLRKEKSFCALAVLVLALGIAGVTTMFGVVNGVMLRGFSFPTADRLVSVNFIDPTTRTFFGVNGQISSLDFEELLPHQQSFEALAAYLNGSTVNVTIDGKPQRLTGAYVTERFLDTLGERPLMGRNFVATDDTSTAAKVAIIGYGMWQRDFGGAA